MLKEFKGNEIAPWKCVGLREIQTGSWKSGFLKESSWTTGDESMEMEVLRESRRQRHIHPAGARATQRCLLVLCHGEGIPPFLELCFQCWPYRGRVSWLHLIHLRPIFLPWPQYLRTRKVPLLSVLSEHPVLPLSFAGKSVYHVMLTSSQPPHYHFWKIGFFFCLFFKCGSVTQTHGLWCAR